jgi:hypothetical protein
MTPSRHRQTDRQTDRQTGRQTVLKGKQAVKIILTKFYGRIVILFHIAVIMRPIRTNI